MKAKIIIEIDEELIDFMMKSDGISSMDELKGYLKGLWQENCKEFGEQVKVSVDISNDNT